MNPKSLDFQALRLSIHLTAKKIGSHSVIMMRLVNIILKEIVEKATLFEYKLKE